MDVNSSAVSMASVLLSWSPPVSSDTSCPPATYTITVTASLFLDPAVMNTTDAVTNKAVSNLTQGQNYSFFVAGVDAGGRVGDNSAPFYLVFDSECGKMIRRGKY